VATIEVVIPAKNELHHLPIVLDALQSQTLKPVRIICVDDGSSDGSGEYLEHRGCKVIRTMHLEYRERGSPDLASVFNLGLREVSALTDYIMMLGADHVLPHNYIEKSVGFMRENQLTMVSGVIEGEPTELPRGSGRIVNAEAWRTVMGSARYPEEYGFETYLVLKLESCGYKVGVLRELNSYVLRATGAATSQVNYGKGMKYLGYTSKYLLGRALVTSIRYKNPIKGLQMIYGYATYSKKSDIAEYFSKRQNELLLSYLKSPRKLYRRIMLMFRR